MLTQFIRWFKGYLKIQLIGYSPERFLNICKNKNIKIWDLRSCKNHYEMNIFLKEFKQLKPICKKTVSKIRILEKNGVPFEIYKFRKHKSFAAGFILCILLTILSCNHLWTIEISGNQRITQDVIQSYLRENSITTGSLLKNINCKNIAANIRNHFGDIIWASLSLDGTKLKIEIRENTDKIKDVKTEDIPVNLVAKYDGTVSQIITRSGIPTVEAGEEVQKGQLLVSGCIPIFNDNKEVVANKYVKADADILGEIVINYSDTIDASYQQKIYTNESLYWNIGFFQTPIENKINKEILIENNLFHFGKIKEYELIEKKYTKEEKTKILEKNYQSYCDHLLENNITILESHFLITHDKERSIAVSLLRLEQPIDECRKIIDLSSEDMVQ